MRDGERNRLRRLSHRFDLHQQQLPVIARAGLVLAVLATTGALGCNSNKLRFVDAGLTDSGTEPGDAGTDGGTEPEDAGPDAGPTIELDLALHRFPSTEGAPDLIFAFVIATDENGLSVSGLEVAIDAGGVIFNAAPDAGFYLATVTPPFTSGELTITASVAGTDAIAQRTALVLPTVNVEWDQPEPVAGLVNTAGTEDSSTVSPDGQWLIVASYSPMDLLCCGDGCGDYPTLDGDNPACVDVLGPVTGPARPGMPGADRVSGSLLTDWSDPQMCAVLPDGGPIRVGDDGGTYPFAFPLVAEYGFHRQADGSYAEPFVIQIDSDGFVGAPFCLTFLGTGDAGDTVPVVMGYGVDSSDGGKPHPWFAEIALGEPNILGSYACESATLPGYPTFTPAQMVPLPVGPVGQQGGNTSVAIVASGAYLLSDDESATPPYVEYSRIIDGGYSDWAPVALPEPGIDRRQPVVAGTRLFYYRAGAIASVAWNGADPDDPNVFSDLATELGPESSPAGRVGEVVAVGQPTFAVIDGGARMFFVYYRRSATGADGQIGSVPLR
jgi:hypothetical protein